MSLKGVADELAAFLQEAAPLQPITDAQLDEVARTAVDYVLTRVSADQGATVFGEAVAIACGALTESTRLAPDAVVERAARFLEDAAAAARALGR